MKQSIFEITENNCIARDIYRMELSGDPSAITAPGQFAEIRIEGRFLRRPISICDKTENGITLIYKTAGHGTEQMAGMKPGKKLDLLTGLGNGYDLKKAGSRPLLIGGGAGVPPLYLLCKELIRGGSLPVVILGFNTKCEVFLEEEFKALNAEVIIAAADGTYGVKGFVTDCMEDVDYTFFYSCGPGPMFRAVEKIARTDGQYSFEERMGCGFGACMGCSIMTGKGPKRVCRDGPVFNRKDIIW